MASYVHPQSERSSTDQNDNPFFLHHNDHAGLVLVTDRLNTASEFHSWRRSIRMALNVRNKLGFIDGTVPKPASTHRDYGAWSRCNDMVATWLMNFVSKKIGQSLLFINIAEEQKLSKREQGSLDVSTYYTELVTFWEEHKNYVELPVCTCGKCECDAAALWEKLQERSRVTKFLMGLIEPYEQTCRHILLLKPIPTIEEAFNFVAQDERQRSLKPATPVDSVAFQNTTPLVHLPDEASYVAAYNTARQVQKPVCTHCGKLGHTVQKCFKLHGYPPGYKTHGAYKNQNQAKNTPVRVPEHQIPFSEVVSKATITDHGIVASTSTSGILPFPSRSLTFENDQLKFHNHCLSTLPSFLPNDAWIIDSGASSHELSRGLMIGKVICIKIFTF
ncbi:hypothetical protein YC2023_004630 [Brassica napus]